MIGGGYIHITKKSGWENWFFSPRSVVALRYLAHYFQIRQLFLDTTSFLEAEMKDLVNLPRHIYEANLYGDARLAEAVTDAAAGTLPKIKNEELLLLPPKMFAGILEKGNLTRNGMAVSKKVAFYCQNQAYAPNQVVDGAMFASMTDEAKMPTVSQEAAVPLLLYLENAAAADEDGDDDEEAIQTNAESLRRRCAEVLSADWQRLATEASASSCAGNKEKKKSSVADLSETSQVKVLQACLTAARGDFASLESAHKRWVKRHRDEVDAHGATKAQLRRFKPVREYPSVVSVQDQSAGLVRAPSHAPSVGAILYAKEIENARSFGGTTYYKALYTYE